MIYIHAIFIIFILYLSMTVKARSIFRDATIHSFCHWFTPYLLCLTLLKKHSKWIFTLIYALHHYIFLIILS